MKYITWVKWTVFMVHLLYFFVNVSIHCNLMETSSWHIFFPSEERHERWVNDDTICIWLLLFFLNKLILKERNNLLLIYIAIVHFLTTHLLWFDRFASINSVDNCLESECYVSLFSACVSHSFSFLATKQLTTNMNVLSFFMHCF